MNYKKLRKAMEDENISVKWEGAKNPLRSNQISNL